MEERSKNVTVDLEEYIELRQESEELNALIEIILRNSKKGYSRDFALDDERKIYDYLMVIAPGRLQDRKEELNIKEDKEDE